MNSRAFIQITLVAAVCLGTVLTTSSAWAEPPTPQEYIKQGFTYDGFTRNPDARAPWTGLYADELPQPTAGEIWLTLGWSKKQTSSPCIGEVTTPLCTLDTFLACLVRDDGRLCAKAEGTKPTRHWSGPPAYAPYPSQTPYPAYAPYPRTGLMRYKVDSVTRISANDAAGLHEQDSDRQEQTGDVRLRVNWEMCGRADQNGHLSDCCQSPYSSVFVTRRQTYGRWILVRHDHPDLNDRLRYHTETKDIRWAEDYYDDAPYCDRIKAPLRILRRSMKP